MITFRYLHWLSIIHFTLGKNTHQLFKTGCKLTIAQNCKNKNFVSYLFHYIHHFILVMIAFLFRHRLIRLIIKWPQIKCIYTNFIFGFYHFSPAGGYNFTLYVTTFIWIMFLKCMYHEKLKNEKFTNYESQFFN